MPIYWACVLFKTCVLFYIYFNIKLKKKNGDDFRTGDVKRREEEDKTEEEWLTNETGFRWHRSLGDQTGTFQLNVCIIYT